MISTPYTVLIKGQDFTSRFRPLIKSITIKRTATGAFDTADFIIADPYGQVAFPQDRDPIEVSIRGAWAFSGFVSDPGWKFDKESGREITISADSVDPGGKAKEQQLRNKDDATLKQVATEWGGKVGLSVQFAGNVGEEFRGYWVQQNESFMSWGHRIAKEVGATFKIIGNRAFFTERNVGLSASGQSLTPLVAAGGVNLISADIRPNVGRPKYKEVEVSYYDIAKGKRLSVKVPTGIDNVDAIMRKVMSSATKDQAEKEAKSAAKESDRNRAEGTLEVLGFTGIEPETDVFLSGCRPGIDGTYRADDVTLKLTKGAGFTASVSIRHPQDGAGVDTR